MLTNSRAHPVMDLKHCLGYLILLM